LITEFQWPRFGGAFGVVGGLLGRKVLLETLMERDYMAGELGGFKFMGFVPPGGLAFHKFAKRDLTDFK
jgi:hypothetical protein